MTEFDYLINMSSWEDRFSIGSEELISRFNIKNFYTFVSQEYAESTQQNRNLISGLCKNKGIRYSEQDFVFNDNLSTWRMLERFFSELPRGKVIFDISTTPREFIWYVLHNLEINNFDFEIVYSKPKEYGKWLSKDPGRPRLLYKHSGITQLGAQTALLLVTGFDLERAGQLIQYFEPKVTFLALQRGEQYNNQQLNIERNLEALERLCEIRSFTIDAFAADGGASELESYIAKEVSNFNIVASSLGPKPSSFALYKLHKKYQNIGLCYIPSTSYNTDSYSTGLSESVIMKP